MAERKPILFGLLVAALMLTLDQASKIWFMAVLADTAQQVIEICPFFNLVMVWNKGISFGMFAGHNQPLALVALSAVIIVILLGWLYKNHSPLVAFALGSIIGGAIGNIIDRLRFGAVADFFDVHAGTWHWPAFNIADSAIFIGVVLLCAHSMLVPQHHRISGGNAS